MVQVMPTNENRSQQQITRWLPPTEPPGRKSLPLSLRISLWLIAVAILPPLIALIMIEIQTRPTLINQASTILETDTEQRLQGKRRMNSTRL